MGVNNFDRVPVASYGGLLCLCGIAFTILSYTIRKGYTHETELTRALAKGNTKGMISLVLYGCSIPLGLYVHPAISAVLFVAVSIMWIIPSKDIERALQKDEPHE